MESDARYLPVERAELASRLALELVDLGSRAVLVGEPGIGKSFLLDQVHRNVTAAGAVVLRAHGQDPYGSEPFVGLIDLLASVGQTELDHLPEIQRLALDVALARVPAPPDLPKMALRAGLGSLVSRLLEVSPVVFVIDDVDKLDPATTGLLRHIMSRPPTAGRRPGLIGTQQDRSDLTGLANETDLELFGASVFRVTGLSLDEFAEVTGIADLSKPDIATLHASTGGNPLWARELRNDPSRPVHDPPVPRSIAALVEARIDAMSPELSRLFTTLAAMGETRPAELRQVVPDAERAIADGIEVGLVSHLDGRMLPSHPMLGIAALNRLTPAQSMALHARIAVTATDPWKRAYHLELSLPPGEDETIATALFVAGTTARDRGDIGSAIGYFQKSISRSSIDGVDYHARVVNLGENLFLSGEYRQAAELLRGFDGCPPDIGLLDRALPLFLDSVLLAEGRAEALSALTELQICRGRTGALAAVIDVYLAELALGEIDDRLAQTTAALAILDSTDEAPVTRHRALKSLIERKLEQGKGLDTALLEQSAAMESRLELLTLTDGAAAQRGFNAWRVDDLETSRVSLEALLDVASSRGETVSANFMVTHLAVVAAMEGRLADASRYLDSFGAADPWISDPVPIFVFASAIRHIASEDDESLESILSGTGPRSGATSRLVRAAVRGIRAARHERWDEALPYLSDAHRTARSQGILEPGRRYWLDIELGETQVGVGDLAGAEETRLRLQRLADQGDRPLMDGVSSRLGGLLHAARGDLDMAEVAFESSIRTLNASPFQIEAARSCLEMGRLLRRTRRRVPARAMLSATLATVTEMGDRPLARRISRELDLVPASRSDTILTPTERRIVDSAASGMSNRQIAAAHLIGVRTVETHLTTIYRKTGVPSRSGLSVWIQAQND